MIPQETIARYRKGLVQAANMGGVIGRPFMIALIGVLDDYENEIRPRVSQKSEASDKRPVHESNSEGKRKTRRGRRRHKE